MIFFNKPKFQIFVLFIAFVLSALLAGRFVLDNYFEKKINNILDGLNTSFTVARKNFSLFNLYYTVDVSEIRIDVGMLIGQEILIRDVSSILVRYNILSNKVLIKLPQKILIYFFDYNSNKYEESRCKISPTQGYERNSIIFKKNNKRFNYKVEILGLSCRINNQNSNNIDDYADEINISYESSGVSYNAQNKLSVLAYMQYLVSLNGSVHKEKIIESSIVSNIESIITSTQRDFYVAIDDYRVSLPLIDANILVSGSILFSIIDGLNSLSFTINIEDYKNILRYFIRDDEDSVLISQDFENFINSISDFGFEDENIIIRIEKIENNIMVNNKLTLYEMIDRFVEIPKVKSYIDDLLSSMHLYNNQPLKVAEQEIEA